MGRAPDGRVTFVPFTAPGDRVVVRVRQVRARHQRAEVETLVEPGPERTDPVCPVFGSCGGCAWQHLRSGAQVEAKARILGDALARIGGLALPDDIHVLPSPDAYAYRARTRVLVRGDRVGYRRRRSHALCAVTRCPILVPAVEDELRRLATDPPAEGEWELAGGGSGARAVRLPAAAGPPVELHVGGERLRISPGVFFQSNALLHEALARAVCEAAGEGRCALDLFAGAGFFTLGLARRFERVVAVEAHDAAARDLAANASAAGLDHIEIERRPLEQVDLEAFAPEVVVLDPPRSGLPPASAERVAALPARRIVYLSCDPATLARDLTAFTARRWRLTRVTGFDLFPQTPHVEALAILERLTETG